MASDSDIQNIPQDLAALAEMKLPLVLEDYRSYFDDASRAYDRLTQLRSWEAALISALSAVIVTAGEPVSPAVIIPLLLLIGVFFLLEGSYRGYIQTIGERALILEQRLQTDNISEFRKNIVNWTFGNTHYRTTELSRVQRYRATLHEVSQPTTVLWHGGLALATIIVVLLSS